MFAAAQLLVCAQLAGTVGLLIHTVSAFGAAHDRAGRRGAGVAAGFAAFWWTLALFVVVVTVGALAVGLLRLERDNVTFFFAELGVGLAGALVGIASGAHPATLLIAGLALSGYAGMYLSFALQKAIERGGPGPARPVYGGVKRPALRPVRRPGRR